VSGREIDALEKNPVCKPARLASKKYMAMNLLRLGYHSSHSLQRAAFPLPQLPAVLRGTRPARAAAFFHAVRRRAQIARPERYGTAKEPPPHLQDAAAADGEGERVGGATAAAAAVVDEAEKGAMEQILDSAGPLNSSNEQQKVDEPAASKTDVVASSSSSSNANAIPDHPAPTESVLNIGQQEDSYSSKLPQLHPPPHMHHFDTWTLVRDLQKGGFSHEQAITIMKAVRLLLAENMDLAQDALVSKSNVENVRAPRLQKRWC
jgi:hypothetical protein